MIDGFALVAYPVEYSVSGVKTFIVNHNRVVWERSGSTSDRNGLMALWTLMSPRMSRAGLTDPFRSAE
jgi:hypothetical protein